MFSAKLNAIESILLVYFLTVPVGYVATVAFHLKGLRFKPPFVRYRQIYSSKVKPL